MLCLEREKFQSFYRRSNKIDAENQGENSKDSNHGGVSDVFEKLSLIFISSHRKGRGWAQISDFPQFEPRLQPFYPETLN